MPKDIMRLFDKKVCDAAKKCIKDLKSGVIYINRRKP